MQAAAGFFLLDFIIRPFAKIYQKMPFITFGILIVLYGIIAYVVIRSAYRSDDGNGRISY